MAKNATQPEETEELVPLEEVLLEAPPDVVVVAAASPIAKRALGVKEPIIFKWKIAGFAHGMILTLFKSVEREDADAQLQRLQGEGYYKDLKILEADAKIVQPPSAKAALKRTPLRPAPPPKPVPPVKVAPPAKPAAPVKPEPKKAPAAPPPKPAPPPKKPAPAKAPIKAPAKSVKKKPAVSSSKKSFKGK